MLARKVEEWPLLICGPVLRRVTATEVAVFAATRVACDVELMVGVADSGAMPWRSPVTRTRTLGSALHVVVCHLRTTAANPLTVGTTYQYDLSMTPTDTGVTERLTDQPGLLTGPEPLGYAANALPSFVLPPGLADLNVLHSSCRKPHGGGPDAMAMVDRLLLRAREKATPAERLSARPHQLLLTGDQIYADDVALTMLATLQEVGGLLCPWSAQEVFPRDDTSAPGVTPTSPEVRPGTSRETFLKDNSTLSSDESMNHLMFFAEFAAMYVMCWSDELWPRDASGHLTPGSVQFEQSLTGKDAEQRTELGSFLATLRRARRVLANVPTMMMFDDHEISDDWHLDGAWFENARKKAAQHRVVRNGLLAFAVFQAWGNEPARFATGVPKSLLDAVTLRDGALASPIAGKADLVDIALDLTGTPGERMSWNWTWEWEGSEHVVVALDSRTRRDYTTLGGLRPGLLTEEQLDLQLSAFAPKSGDTRLRFVVAPAPVVGHPFVEGTVQPWLALVKSVRHLSWTKGGRAADSEAWAVNRLTYQSVLRRLAAFGRVVVLSGDVHYGYTNHTAYFGAGGQAPARIVQLCSSAAKNADFKTRVIQFGGLVGRDGESWLGVGTRLPDVTRVLLAGALGAAVEAVLTPLQHSLLLRVGLLRKFEPPAVLPMGEWRSPSAALAVRNLAEREDPRDWRYRTRFVFDDRPGTERLATAREIDPRVPSVAAEHVAKHAHRVVVGEPNIGQIRVRTVEGKNVVQHRLHYMTSADPANAAQACTEHMAPLDPPGPGERPVPR